jgi:hypothetical protein
MEKRAEHSPLYLKAPLSLFPRSLVGRNLLGVWRARSVFLFPLLFLSQNLDHSGQCFTPPAPASYKFTPEYSTLACMTIAQPTIIEGLSLNMLLDFVDGGGLFILCEIFASPVSVLHSSPPEILRAARRLETLSELPSHWDKEGTL